MSAKVEIIAEELIDVIYVPVQAVFVENQEHFVFLKTSSGCERHLVEAGSHNNEFIEVISGLDEGDEVLLKMPEDYEPAELEVASSSRPRIESKESSEPVQVFAKTSDPDDA